VSQDCTENEKKVLDRLRSLYAAYSRKDIDGVILHFAPDPDVVVIGACRDEKVVGVDSIRETWEHSVQEQPHDMHVEISWISVSCRETVAWFSSELHCTVPLDHESTLNLITRATGVMEKRGQDWLVCQYHASYPTPGVGARNVLDHRP
jgi:ketosteroid isomerase-like protein